MMNDSNAKQVFWFKKGLFGGVHMFEKPYGDARNYVSFHNVTEVEGVEEAKLFIKQLKGLGIKVKQYGNGPTVFIEPLSMFRGK